MQDGLVERKRESYQSGLRWTLKIDMRKGSHFDCGRVCAHQGMCVAICGSSLNVCGLMIKVVKSKIVCSLPGSNSPTLPVKQVERQVTENVLESGKH